MFGKSIITGVCLVTLLAVTGGPVLAYAPDAPLANAAMRGDLEAVRSLLAAGQADVNVAQGDGTTALHWAAYRDDAEMARLLVDAGAEIGPKTRLGDITPLFMAAKNGSAEMIGLLLDAGADARSTNANGTTPLMLAAAAGSEASLGILLDRGADVNAQDTTNGQTAVMFASSLGRTPAVRLLAERGADLDVNTNVSEIIKREYRYRLRQDPNRSQQTRVEGASNLPVMGGMTAMLFATREGHAEVVHELVAAGADVNVVNAADGMSPLVSAIINGGFDIAMFLVEHGADPDLATHGRLDAALCSG